MEKDDLFKETKKEAFSNEEPMEKISKLNLLFLSAIFVGGLVLFYGGVFLFAKWVPTLFS